MWCILYWAGGFCGKAQILLYTRAHITSCFTLDKKTPPHIYPQIKHTKHGRLHLHFISSGAPYINLLQFCFVIAGNERVSNKKKRHHFYFYRFLPVSKKYLERRSSFRRAAVSVIYGLPFFSLSRSFFFFLHVWNPKFCRLATLLRVREGQNMMYAPKVSATSLWEPGNAGD